MSMLVPVVKIGGKKFEKFLSHGKFNGLVVTSFIFTMTLKVFSLGLPIIYISTPNVPILDVKNYRWMALPLTFALEAHSKSDSWMKQVVFIK